MWNAAVSAYPERPETWYGLADSYFHWGMLAGIEDALARAENAYRRGWALDSAANGSAALSGPLIAETMDHLVVLAHLRGDTAEVLRLTALVLATDSTSDLARKLSWHRAAVLGPSAAARVLGASSGRWPQGHHGDCPLHAVDSCRGGRSSAGGTGEPAEVRDARSRVPVVRALLRGLQRGTAGRCAAAGRRGARPAARSRGRRLVGRRHRGRQRGGLPVESICRRTGGRRGSCPDAAGGHLQAGPVASGPWRCRGRGGCSPTAPRWTLAGSRPGRFAGVAHYRELCASPARSQWRSDAWARIDARRPARHRGFARADLHLRGVLRGGGHPTRT